MNDPNIIKKMFLFKHSNFFKWDNRNHPFYENVINGKKIHDINISRECSSVNVNKSF